MSYESALRARKGMVASAHSLASSCGTKVLSSGGNVIDAAIATSAVLCVVQNNSCGLGGDAFAIIKIGDRVLELNGSGRAARQATIDYYENMGYATIPSTGPLACITVPGLVHAWGEMLQYATLELSDLLDQAITLAQEGFALNPKYVESIRTSANILGQFPGWRELFMPGGAVPSVGFRLKQKELASALSSIAREGTETFYDGELSEKIVRGARQDGALIDEEDFREHTSNWSIPLSTDYRGTRIYETSPNSQAATVLLWLNMLERHNFNAKDSLLRIMVDCCVKAYGQRAKWISDPTFSPLPVEFTSKSFAEDIFESEPHSEESLGHVSENGDTTYFAIGDRDGDCVSMIQSNYGGFGSGVVPKNTGLVLHNRGCYFTLDKSHHNALAPRKRTFHTLCASLGERDGKTAFAIGTMGGDIQPQVHVQLMTKILDLKKDPQEAVSSPRWFIPGSIYESLKTIFYETSSFGSEKNLNGLKRIQISGLTSAAGHAQAIVFESDRLLGGADPRCDGVVSGY